MEEAQEVIKHVCRICCKSFPCGRSLGGHMRSHDHVKTNDHHHGDDDDDDDDDESFVVASASTVKKEEGCSEGYYGLRENPKKTWRVLTDSTSDDQEETFDVVLDKLCKECGRGFQSWKALFGHMKCHSSSKNNGFEMDEQESNTDAAAVLPNRKRRSKRRLKTRYLNSKSSSSVVAANSVSEEEEHEQKEVAMSLMMLSRDVRSWCGLNSIAESSNNDDNKGKSLEIFDEDSKGNDGLKMKKTRVSVIENGKDKKNKVKIEVDSDSAFEVNVRSKPGTSSTSKVKYTSMKEKFYDCETKVSSEVEIGAKKSRKRGKFECATCNRVFHSYQALGGHRASHKRSRGCFASKIDQNSDNENIAELEMEVDMKINDPDEGRILESEGVVVEEVSEIRNFLDLNLPADGSIVDERHGHSEIYTPWWLDGSNFKQEAMVGLLSN